MLSMLVAFFIVPGSLLASLAATVALVVVLSVLVATIAGPAVLTLLGPNLDRWRIGAPAAGERSAPDGRRHRRPAPAGRRSAIAIGAVVLLLAAPALALKTGPPSPDQLAKNNPARARQRTDRPLGRPRLRIARSSSSPPPTTGRSPSPTGSTR